MKHFKLNDRISVRRGGRKPFKGKVQSVSNFPGQEPGISVIEDGFNSAHDESPFHPSQCRRLKPKAKTVKKEPRRLIVSFDLTGKVAAIARPFETTPHLGNFYSDNDMVDFVEILPGHVLINRQVLERVFLASGAEMMNFEALAKELGLTEVKP